MPGLCRFALFFFFSLFFAFHFLFLCFFLLVAEESWSVKMTGRVGKQRNTMNERKGKALPRRKERKRMRSNYYHMAALFVSTER